MIAAGGISLVAWPEHAPWLVLAGLALAAPALVHAWKESGGTALRASVTWAAIAIGLGVITECLALFEPVQSGRPVTGHVAYLCCLAALAALISVLNARVPGGGAWAILMALLVVVFLIPWLEGPGFGRVGNGLARLQLGNPWTIFFGVLVFAGVTNYLPTRHGTAAACVAVGFVLEYLALTRWIKTPRGLATVWAAVPWTLAAAAAMVPGKEPSRESPTREFDLLWLWFRDHWGAVWGLRVLERFNRTATSLDWPMKLHWEGLQDTSGQVVRGGFDGPPREDALAVLTSLLRRFATSERLGRASGVVEVPPLPRP